MVKTLILCGDGINCERETAMAFERGGSATDIIHINKLMRSPKILHNYRVFVIPGGFSFGDEIGSGKVLSLKIKKYLKDAIDAFLLRDNRMLGICNGLQVITSLGLLPHPKLSEQSIALAPNKDERFVNKWVETEIQESSCLWTKGMEGKKLELPIRNREGRVLLKNVETRTLVLEQKLVALKYCDYDNGSDLMAAGLTDTSGKILGLMPHPESYWKHELHPLQTKKEIIGQDLIDNCLYHLKESK